MGLCYISTGLIHAKPKFRRTEAGHHSVLMLLTVAAVLFPTSGAMAICGGAQCTGGGAARQVQVEEQVLAPPRGALDAAHGQLVGERLNRVPEHVRLLGIDLDRRHQAAFEAGSQLESEGLQFG